MNGAGVARVWSLVVAVKVKASPRFYKPWGPVAPHCLILTDPEPGELDTPRRPWWTRRSVARDERGGVELEVTAEEFADVDVGDVFYVRVSGPHS